MASDNKTLVVTKTTTSGLQSRQRDLFLLLCSLPVAAILLTLIVARLRLPVAILLTAFCVVGAMSVGMFFLPSALLLFLKNPFRIGPLELRP